MGLIRRVVTEELFDTDDDPLLDEPEGDDESPEEDEAQGDQ